MERPFHSEPPLAATPDDSRRQMSLAAVDGAVQEAKHSLDVLRDMVGQLTGTSPNPRDDMHEAVIRAIPRWHFLMINDAERNASFAAALERLMPTGSNVLDIGSGTGLLAMMAARAGAGTVTTCEGNPVLAGLARRIIARQGLSDVITVIPKMSTDLRVGVDLPARADVIVSEIVDCGLLGEGLLPVVRHAREHLLAPGGLLIPESARLVGALVNSVAIDRLNRVDSAAGFDVRLFNEVATEGHFPVRLNTWPHQMLSPAVELASFDFASDPLTDGRALLDIPVATSGPAHALVVWFDMTLGKGVVLSNSPNNLATHWMQACVPLPTPISVRAGGSVQVQLAWRRNRLSIQHLTTTQPSE
ncbi:50S ribosomal protein L11 methyltransferase [Longispora fulva]|nr:50S ribosomal protein L11 methyltransferase [Longispora fulva]